MKGHSIIALLNSLLTSMVRLYLKLAYFVYPTLCGLGIFWFILGWGLADSGAIDGSKGWILELIIYHALKVVLLMVLIFHFFCCAVILVKSLFSIYSNKENIYVVLYSIVGLCFPLVLGYVLSVSFVAFLVITIVLIILSFICLNLHKRVSQQQDRLGL